MSHVQSQTWPPAIQLAQTIWKFYVQCLDIIFAIEWHRSSTRDDAGSNGETVNEGGRYSVTSEVLHWRLAVIGRVSELTIRNVAEEGLGYYWCVVVKDSNPLPNPSRILHLTNFCASCTVCGSLQLNNPTRRKIRLVTLRTIVDTVVSKSLVSKSALLIQHWPIRTITNDITSILIGHLQIFKFCSLTNDLQTTVYTRSNFHTFRQEFEHCNRNAFFNRCNSEDRKCELHMHSFTILASVWLQLRQLTPWWHSTRSTC